MQTRRALLLAASLGLVVSCDTADMSDPSGEEQEGTGVETPSGSDSSEGDSDSPANKIHVSDSVKGALSRGEETVLIVTLNERGVTQKSKVASFASMRKTVMKDLAGIRAHMIQEFESIPYMILRATDVSVLEALAESESVAGVFENQVMRPASAGVLSAIRWTPVASPGTGSGAGINVAVLDSNVSSTFAGGNVTASSPISGDADTNEIAPTHGDAMVGAIRAVAPGATVFAIDISKNNVVTQAEVLTGLQSALTIDGTNALTAVNLSYEGDPNTSANQFCDSNALHAAIANLKNAGVAVVVAAGNGGSNSQLSEPACDSNVISVGATFDAALTGTVTFNKTGATPGTCTNDNTNSETDKITCFSNYSTKLTLLAPGAMVDLDWDGSTGVDNPAANLKYGTSFSAAFVTGAIAALQDTYGQDTKWLRNRLLLSTNPMVTRTGITAPTAVVLDLDATASMADKCFTAVDDNTVDFTAAGVATPANVNVEYNKAGCTPAVTGLPTTPAWLTVAPGPLTGLTQPFAFTGVTTNDDSIRYATATCPNTDAFGSDKNTARCVLISTETGTHDDSYVRVSQAGDTVGPTGVTLNANVSIAGGDEVIVPADDAEPNTPNVQVHVTANVDAVTDAVATAGFKYCFSSSITGAGCVYKDLTFDTVLDEIVTLTSGDGQKTVYLIITDPAGNRSTPGAGASDTTYVDTAAPGAGTLTVTSELNQVSLSYTAANNNGSPYAAARLLRGTDPATLVCGGATPVGTALTTGWTAPYATAQTFTENATTPVATPQIVIDGSVTYHYVACVQDGAGNWSAAATASARPRGDVVAPTLSAVFPTTVTGTTGSFASIVAARKCVRGANNNPNLCYTNSTGVEIEFTGLTGSATEYCFSNVQNGCTASSTNWVTLGATPTPGTCNSAEPSTTDCVRATIVTTALIAGPRTYNFFVRDAAKNISTGRALDLYYDITAPPTGRISITPGVLSNAIQWAGALDTGSKNNRYKVVALAAPATPAAGCGDGTVVAEGETPATFPVTHNDLNGADPATSGPLVADTTYNYRVCITDRAGNTSDGSQISGKIRPEIDGPVPLSANGTPAHAIVDGCAAISAEPACETANCYWTGSACAPNMVRLGGSAWSKKTQVRVWFGAQDAATPTDTTGLEVCASSTSVLVRNCTAWQSYDQSLVETNTGYLTSLAGDGEKYIGGWVRDKWGNVSDSNASVDGAQSYRDKINIDRTAPTAGSATATLPVGTTTATIALSGVADAAGPTAGGFARGLIATDNGFAVYASRTATPPGPSVCRSNVSQGRVCEGNLTVDGTTGVGSASCTVANLAPGTYSYRACAKDGVDNWNDGAATGSITVPKP